MIELAPGWRLDVDAGQEWLFFRLHGDPFRADTHPPLAERLWELAQEHRLFRLVLELEESVLLSSHLVGQLMLLHKRISLHGGVFRLCGLSSHNYRVIELMRLADRFPNYASREAAVMGRRPNP